MIRESTLALSAEEVSDIRSKLKRGLTPASDRGLELGNHNFFIRQAENHGSYGTTEYVTMVSLIE